MSTGNLAELISIDKACHSPEVAELMRHAMPINLQVRKVGVAALHRKAEGTPAITLAVGRVDLNCRSREIEEHIQQTQTMHCTQHAAHEYIEGFWKPLVASPDLSYTVQTKDPLQINRART